MGVIDRLIGGPAAATALGSAVESVAEVFVPNATRKMEKAHDAFMATVAEQGEEFRAARDGAFDRFVNGLNRLPRPMLALGTLGLFAYAMIDPTSFAQRMVGLAYVPEPLWWLLAAVVGFYFGAREAHYFRVRPPRPAPPPPAATATAAATAAAPDPADDNAALAEWRATQG